jgi:hypothetical protein
MAPLRASLARSPPRLGRSQAGGLHPQTPRAAPPGAPSRTGPLLPRSPSRRGSGHGCARWPGWSTACGCPRWTPSPSPSPLDSVFQKQGNRSVGKPQACPPEGVSPCSGGGGQTPAPPAGRLSTLGGQRGCPRPERVQGGAVVQNNLIGQTFLVLHNQPAQSRASIGFQENHCIKK